MAMTRSALVSGPLEPNVPMASATTSTTSHGQPRRPHRARGRSAEPWRRRCGAVGVGRRCRPSWSLAAVAADHRVERRGGDARLELGHHLAVRVDDVGLGYARVTPKLRRWCRRRRGSARRRRSLVEARAVGRLVGVHDPDHRQIDESSWCSWANLTSSGCSAWQGAHHDPKKSMTTHWPRWSSTSKCAPSSVVPLTAGTALPTTCERDALVVRALARGQQGDEGHQDDAHDDGDGAGQVAPALARRDLGRLDGGASCRLDPGR